MELIPVLEDLGLKEGEIKVYLDLLKHGQSTVAKINERVKLHRTTIYDFLELLIEKGLVSFITISNAKNYEAKDPKFLYSVVNEKKENIDRVLPQLQELQDKNTDDFSVQVLKGREAIKFWLNDMLNINENVIAFGIDEDIFNKHFKYEVLNYAKKKEQKKYTERLLTRNDATFLYENIKGTQYKFLPVKYFNPTPIMVYGNRIMTLIWEPLHIIMIENEELADAHRKNFELLWKIAKDKPLKKVRKKTI